MLNGYLNKIGWFFVGNLGNAIYQFFLIALVAKYSDLETLGHFGLAYAICTPALILANFALREALITDARRLYDDFEYVTLRFYLVLFVATIILLTANGLSANIYIFLLTLGLKSIESITDIYYAILQKNGKNELIGKVMALLGIVSLLSFYLAAKNGNILFGLFLISVIKLFFLVIVFFMCRNYFKATKKWRPNFLIIRDVFPLAIASILSSLTINIPRYTISDFLGVEYVGIFTVLIQIIVSGNILVSSLVNVYLPRAATCIKDNEIKLFFSFYFKSCALSVFFSIICMLAFLTTGKQIILLLYGEKLVPYLSYFILSSIVSIFYYIYCITNSFYAATREFRKSLFTNIILSFLVVIFCSLSTLWGLFFGVFISLASAWIISTLIYYLFFLAWIKKNSVQFYKY